MRKYILVLIALVFSSCMTMSVLASETVDPSVELDIVIANEILGDEPLEDVSFFYAIKGMELEYPLPDNIIAYIEGQGSASFDNLLFTTPGIYQYQIYQLSGEQEEYSYDETIYEVTVYITNDGNGGVEATVYAVKDDTEFKSASITFANTYTSPIEVEINPGSETTEDATTETGDDANMSHAIFLMVLSLSMIAMLMEKQRLNNNLRYV